jgi:GNAT superfamily N-acetyltransferase
MLSATSTTPMAAPIALRADHLAQACALSGALKWPYREEDWRFALELGHGLAVEADGRLVATALWWPYDDAFASCGMIIVATEFQGKGIGRRLMDELLRQASGRTIILNSTREGHALYERLAFVDCGELSQHQALLAQAPATPHVDGIRPFRRGDLAAIVDLDRRATGMGRSALLEAVFALGSGLVIERAGRISGYGCVRRWGRGVVIGPVVATDATDAKSLIAGLAAPHAGGFVRIDVPSASGLSQWLAEIGLPCVDRVVSMVRGTPAKPAPHTTLFALSNQSLG